MKVELKRRVETKFFVLPKGSVHQAERIEGGRYRVHVSQVVSVVVGKDTVKQVTPSALTESDRQAILDCIAAAETHRSALDKGRTHCTAVGKDLLNDIVEGMAITISKLRNVVGT